VGALKHPVNNKCGYNKASKFFSIFVTELVTFSVRAFQKIYNHNTSAPSWLNRKLLRA